MYLAICSQRTILCPYQSLLADWIGHYRASYLAGDGTLLCWLKQRLLDDGHCRSFLPVFAGWVLYHFWSAALDYPFARTASIECSGYAHIYAFDQRRHRCYRERIGQVQPHAVAGPQFSVALGEDRDKGQYARSAMAVS